MADGGYIHVTGLRELIAAADAADKETKTAVRDLLRHVGDRVAADARGRFSSRALYSPRTATGFRPYVKRAGAIVVEQSRRKTTGKRPDWGSRQMTSGLIPAVADQEVLTQRDLEEAVATIAAGI